MTNLIWYIGLAIIGVGSATYAIYMKRDIYRVSTLLVFYLFVTGLTWIGEFIVLGLFDSYAYKPGLFTDPWAQNLLGHLIVNTTLYPSLAIVMMVYSLRYGWFCLVAVLFTLIEVLFVNLGIYEQHWWKYYMTIIAVIFFLSIELIVFKKINQRYNRLTRAAIFYFVAVVILHTPTPILLLLGKQHYQLSSITNLVDNLYLTSILISFFYHLIESFFLVLLVCILKNWYWKLLPFIITIITQSIFLKMNILMIDNDWNFFYTLVSYEIFIAVFILIEKYTMRQGLSYRFK